MTNREIAENIEYTLLHDATSRFTMRGLVTAALDAKDAALAEANAEIGRLREAMRPSVRDFASRMEATLRKHDARKGGQSNWRKDEATDLLRRLDEEVYELREAVGTFSIPRPIAAKEAIDVANFAMMIHDVLEPLATDTAALIAAKEQTNA